MIVFKKINNLVQEIHDSNNLKSNWDGENGVPTSIKVSDYC